MERYLGSGAESRPTHKILTPFLEAGFQVSNYFDAFLGFCWFDLSDSFDFSEITQVYTGRMAYRDTFPFRSEINTDTWSHVTNNATVTEALGITQFFSGSRNQAAPAPSLQSVIFPNGYSDSYGGVPTRRFFEVIGPRGPVYPALYSVHTYLHMQAYEFRNGVRSWFPLGGRARLATSTGFLFTPVQFIINTTGQYTPATATAASIAQNSPAVNPGDVLISYQDHHKDVRWAYGGFCGLELELGGFNFFLKSNAEYNYYFNSISYGSVVLTTMNVGGFTGTITLGRRF